MAATEPKIDFEVLMEQDLFNDNSLHTFRNQALSNALHVNCLSGIYLNPWISGYTLDGKPYCKDEISHYKDVVLPGLEKMISDCNPYSQVILGDNNILDFCKVALKQSMQQAIIFRALSVTTWIACILHIFSNQNYIFNEQDERLLKNVLREIVEISDEDLQFDVLKILGKAILYDRQTVLMFLEKLDKKRYYILSLSLYSVFVEGNCVTATLEDGRINEIDRESKEGVEIFKISSLLGERFYREGVYNRAATNGLVALSKARLQIKFKIKLLMQCYLSLYKQPDKYKHRKIWDLLRTIIVSDLSPIIENFLRRQDNTPFTFQKLYGLLFSEAFKLSPESQALYFARFNHPEHHLLLGYRQTMLEENQPIFEHLVKTVLDFGETGYRALRYENLENPHLLKVFSEESTGEYLQHVWSESSNFEVINTGKFAGCTVHDTDDIFKILTWGCGLNCLEPLHGKIYLLPHLCDGQNRLLLLLDKNNQVIAGCLFHLLLRGPENPKTVLVLSPIYIQDHYLNQLDLAREHLDIIARKRAAKMGLHLFAFEGGKCPNRTNAKNLVMSEGIFSLKGFIKAGFCNGIDELSSPINRAVRDGFQYYHNYQELYSPSETDQKSMIEKVQTAAKEIDEFQKVAKELAESISLGVEPSSIVMGYLFNRSQIKGSCDLFANAPRTKVAVPRGAG